MAVRPLIRPRPRVIAPTVTPGLSPAELAELPRVLSRVIECNSVTDPPAVHSASQQAAIVVTKPQVVPELAASATTKREARESISNTSTVTKPTLPAFWQSRKVLIAASLLALVSAIAIGYQFRPKQQIIVVHPAKPQTSLVASPTQSLNPANMKQAYQPLSPATFPASNQSKETTSTAKIMPGATWPAEKTPAAAPRINPTPPIQTATKPLDTRTSSIQAPGSPVARETVPPMPSHFPQAPNPTTNSPSNASVVFNPTMNGGASPLASSYAPQNNQPPQYGAHPACTASRPELQPRQPQPAPDGSFGAYGGAQLVGQIQPLLRR